MKNLFGESMKEVLIILLSICFGMGCLHAKTITPVEDGNAVLHNPDMGWVLCENYPLDQRPGPSGSSNITVLPSYNFPGVDCVTLMFAWSDVETSEGVYDFSKVNYAYDYWSSRDKKIQLRMSAESLLWWNDFTPPAGVGVPQYVLDGLPAGDKQVRNAWGHDYTVVDARNSYYLSRLAAFLQAVETNFSTRPVELIDLRGFGLWGEWHSGFLYPTDTARRNALIGIIDTWSAAFPSYYLALSYSHDTDGPTDYYMGGTTEYEPGATYAYDGYLNYSAFDYALTKDNVTYRRDGCGGAVYSNQRRLAYETFDRKDKGPMTSEFCGSYTDYRDGGGWWTLERAIDDALDLHPNYITILGWQTYQAKMFIEERPDLFDYGLINMGYRLVPISVTCPNDIFAGSSFQLEMEWVNRAVGRADRDYKLRVLLKNSRGDVALDYDAGSLPTSDWVKGEQYNVTKDIPLGSTPAGTYDLYIAMIDPDTGLNIELPLANKDSDGSYMIIDRVSEQGYLSGDINKDYYVNFLDIAELSLHWLECSAPKDPTCQP